MTIGRLFRGSNRIYFALYPEHPNLHIGVPLEVKKYFERCANIIFKSSISGSGNDKDSSIDLFLLKDRKDYELVKSILYDKLKKRCGHPNLHVEDTKELVRRCGLEDKLVQAETDTRFGIRYRIKKEFKNLTREIVQTARADIYQFFLTREKPLRQDNETRVTVLEEVLQPTKIRRLGPVRIKLGTKSIVHPFCYQDLAIDFTNGCKSYEEVIELEKDKKVFVFNPWLGCSYCYNRWVNKHHFSYGYHPADKEDLITQIKELRETVFKGKKIRALRIGQGTECFTPELIEHLLVTVEAAYEENIPVVIPTKTPFFDREVAKTLKNCNVSLMVSLGLDELEIGVCKQGFTNKTRIEFAQQYHSAGVRTILYPLTDLTTHPEKQKTWSVREAYKLNQEKGIPIQFLVFRTNSSELLRKITDLPSLGNYFKGQGLLQAFVRNGYYFYQQEKYFIPIRIHPFFKEIMEKSNPTIGVCSVIPSWSACSACFVPGLDRRKGVQEKKPLPHIEKIREEKLKRTKKTRQKIFSLQHRFQHPLFKNESK